MKRKIIEIYATEDEENNTISFDFEKVDDSGVANSVMKMLVSVFSELKDECGSITEIVTGDDSDE